MSNAQESLIARRYAKAFVALAAEQKKLDKVAGDIDSLMSLQSDKNFAGFLKNRSIERDTQLNVMRSLSKKMKLDSLTTNYLGTIIENGRLVILPEVLEASAQAVADQQGEVQATVTSARALTDKEVADLKKALKTATGQDIDVTLKHDERLIGGLKIQVGSLLIDQTVKTRLERLERALKSDAPEHEAKTLRDAA